MLKKKIKKMLMEFAKVHKYPIFAGNIVVNLKLFTL